MNTTGKQKDQITPVKRDGKLMAWRRTTLSALLYLNASTSVGLRHLTSVGLPFLGVVYFITVPVGCNWKSHYFSGAAQLRIGDCCDKPSVKAFYETER